MHDAVISRPSIIPRAEHCISRSDISNTALKVLYGLKEAGFEAYLVGGGVRDLLLGLKPKDFDVATDARPEQVKATFRNCRLIGRRFRLAHVYFGRDIIEVATFRGAHAESGDSAAGVVSANGQILRDNVYGDRDEDAARRDFSVNALYYNIADFSVIDYFGGIEDLARRRIRMIGDAAQRYREDPVRMLRAVRFAAKLGFDIDPDTAAPIRDLAATLLSVPSARRFDETLKLLLSGHGQASYELLGRLGLDHALIASPQVESASTRTFHRQGLANTDERVAANKPVSPAFLFAVLLWPVFEESVAREAAAGAEEYASLMLGAQTATRQQNELAIIPKRFALPMQEIWTLQSRLEQRRSRRALRLLSHPRFRAAYDFLAMREAAGEAVGDSVAWWTDLQQAHPEQRKDLLEPERRGRRRRSKKRQAVADLS